MKKTHWYNGTKNVCGQPVNMLHDRSLNINTNTFRTDCGSCILRNEFQEAHQKAVLAKEAAFQAQEPREYGEPWKDGVITCKNGHTLLRYRGRSCYGHYDDWECSQCEDKPSRLTETGMSF